MGVRFSSSLWNVIMPSHIPFHKCIDHRPIDILVLIKGRDHGGKTPFRETVLNCIPFVMSGGFAFGEQNFQQ